MHSTEITSFNDPLYGMKNQNPCIWTIHHNGDYSGNVKMIVSTEWIEKSSEPFWLVNIPFEVLEELVGQKMQSDQISKLEQMTGIEFLEIHGSS